MSGRKGMVICFTGIDGSGKTTLANLLVDAMKRRGVNCNYAYGRCRPIISLPLLVVGKFLFLKDKDIREYSEYSNTKRKAIEKHPILTSLYQNIILFDYSLQILIKLIFPLMLGKTVVCDRYVYDTVINDIPRLSDNIDKIESLLKKCFRLAPEPDIAFLIDVPENLAYQRKNDTPSIEYLKERREIYIQIGKKYEMTILDGSKDLEELEEIIRNICLKSSADVR